MAVPTWSLQNRGPVCPPYPHTQICSPSAVSAYHALGILDRGVTIGAKSLDIDQATRNVDRFEIYQGIANLAPNGPLDGGLCVLKGSHVLHNQYFAETGGPKADKEAVNGYTYGYDEIQWYKDHGCQEIKVCADEGDLIGEFCRSTLNSDGGALPYPIVWDSRTIHWNASPTGKQIRFATYVCYCPRSMASDEVLNAKKEVFAARKGTTHWPASLSHISATSHTHHTNMDRIKMSFLRTEPTTWTHCLADLTAP